MQSDNKIQVVWWTLVEVGSPCKYCSFLPQKILDPHTAVYRRRFIELSAINWYSENYMYYKGKHCLPWNLNLCSWNYKFIIVWRRKVWIHIGSISVSRRFTTLYSHGKYNGAYLQIKILSCVQLRSTGFCFLVFLITP